MPTLRRLAVERLMGYHRFLAETRGRVVSGTVTSDEIAAALDLDATQVRKDLGAIGIRGRGRIGYDIDHVIGGIRTALGFDRTHLAVLVGAGHLGRALSSYRGFARYGLRIAAAFDTDPDKVGQSLGGQAIRHTRGLRGFVRHHGIRLAILATPAEVSQKIADRLTSAGIEAIWNFAPLRLTVPQGVCVHNEHISVGLSELTHHLTERDRVRSGARPGPHPS